MTDFFAQLAARYRGEADVLRPRVPFRFEPVGASLAAADLTRDAAASSEWPGAHPQRPFRRPGGPGRHDEPWHAPAAGGGNLRTAGLGSELAMAVGIGRAGRDAGRAMAAPAETAEPETARRAAPRRAAPRSAGAWPGQAEAAAAGAAALGRTAVPGPAERGALPERHTVASAAEPGVAEPGVAEPGAAEPGMAAQVVWWDRRSGPGGDPDEADAAAGADAGRSGRRSQLMLRPEPPGNPGRQLSGAAPAPARGRPSDQRRAQGHAVGEPAGPGQESITVQVTIGRVEVRAALPASKAVAAPRSPAGPSLADYLRHRSRSAGALP